MCSVRIFSFRRLFPAVSLCFHRLDSILCSLPYAVSTKGYWTRSEESFATLAPGNHELLRLPVVVRHCSEKAEAYSVVD